MVAKENNLFSLFVSIANGNILHPYKKTTINLKKHFLNHIKFKTDIKAKVTQKFIFLD